MASSYQEKVHGRVRLFIERQGWEFTEKEEGTNKRFDIRHGKSGCVAKVHATGTLQIQGAASKLKETLCKLKEAIESDTVLADEFLPFEIEAFPETIQASIPSIDPIIVHFFSEAILCLKANSLLGCSCLLGAASEKAIWLLIQAYEQAIADEKNQAKFKERISNKFISRSYDKFKRSFNSCKSKPSDPTSIQDLDTKIE